MVDERIQRISGYSAAIMLGLTQTALGAIILVRAYVLDQPDEEFRDIQILLLLSIFGFFFLRSWLGGHFPVPTWKQAALIWAGFSLLLFAILSLWFGLPALSEWTTTILPVTVGPAFVVGVYWIVAYLGRKRLEQSLDAE